MVGAKRIEIRQLYIQTMEYNSAISKEMSPQATKRHRGTSTVYCSVKQANLEKLDPAQLQPCDSLRKQKDPCQPRGRGTDEQAERRQCLEQ